ncbi:uncharacterized protein LOC105220438 isoform X2 [Zeugodacus cucurbitae]|uniref:uncharacterized protein LOC105220438 isoform X2 n=1 Tax=Zeugodacus cucurbitae TaxID=28588 RepID=UPI0023D94CCA|nr:uncharacterized protein LOC105220438 isoform X2 [Zeugodacus cucurbitae]
MPHTEIQSGKQEEKLKLTIRFKQLARSALLNQQWLSNLIDQHGTQIPLYRPKEKNLLHKYRDLRSNSERLALVNLMAHLIVFSQIPPKLRARLAPYAYFIIIGPKRKILEQGREPLCVYFVLTGDINVTTKIWNSIKKKYIEKLEYISGPGEWLGDIDFLENRNRQHTFTSKSEVELLALDRDDFERILMPYVKKAWEDKKSALRYLEYFNFFTKEQLVSACQLATLQQFEPYETIYNEDKGLETFVYFVLSGTCIVLQCLEMKVHTYSSYRRFTKRKWKNFELVDIVKSEEIFKNLSLAEIRSHMRVKSIFSLATNAAVEDESQSDDNIDVQQQRKEKTLLRTHHYLRSIEDRKKLVNLLASLTCFTRLPPKVRARLAPVIKLSFVGPGRKIIKEGDPPSTVYFILSGEVEVYRNIYDRAKNTYVDKLDSISGPGDCLGDIEMIEGCDRLNTYISRNQVELLVLHEDDFNSILRPTMSKQWIERKEALLALEYFKYLNDDQIISACKLGLIRQFDPLETIYYEDKGHVSYVHFVISGECMILQCLKMKVTTKPGGKSFELFDISANEDDNLFQDSVLNISKDGIFRNKSSFFDVNYEIMSEEDDKNKKGSRLFQKMDLKSIEASCGLKGISEEEITSGKDSRFSKEYLNESEDEEYCSQFTDYPNTQRISVENMHGYLLSSGSNIDKQRISNIKNKENIPPSDEWRSREDYFNGPNSNIELGGISSTKKECNTKIENHFIDVGSITFGGIFSLGEKLEHRVIMARTTVQCLMLPRYWLMERDQNPGNIWQRRRFYLDSTIPSREQLFKDFLTTRTWQKFKNSIISSNFTRYLGNPTKVQDIPIICRIVEPSED